MATTDVRSQETSTMIPRRDVATMTDAETIASLRASLAAAEAELLALTHRATTAEATVTALMDDGAATLSALRDAAVTSATRHATAAELARCLAAATRVGAFAACDEMLRDAPDVGETPPQAYGRGVAEGRRMVQRRDDAAPIGPPVWSHEELTAAVEAGWEECARLCDAEARRLAAMVAYGNHVAGIAAEKVGNVAADIRARAPQLPPQRPEAPRDGATPTPDATAPARGLSVAAAKGSAAAASEADALREALRFLCRADVEPCEFCGATATKRSPDGRWWSDSCAPPDAVDHEHAATLRPLLPTRGGGR